MRFLLVDDDPILLRALARMLRSTGIDGFATAGGVEEAFLLVESAAAHGKPFDLVMSDIDMADGTGFDLVQRLQDKAAVPRFVFMSAHVDEARVRCAQSFGSKIYDKMNLRAIDLKAAFAAALAVEESPNRSA